MIEFAKNSDRDVTLGTVTYEEERTLNAEGYAIEVIPLKRFLVE